MSKNNGFGPGDEDEDDDDYEDVPEEDIDFQSEWDDLTNERDYQENIDDSDDSPSDWK